MNCTLVGLIVSSLMTQSPLISTTQTLTLANSKFSRLNAPALRTVSAAVFGCRFEHLLRGAVEAHALFSYFFGATYRDTRNMRRINKSGNVSLIVDNCEFVKCKGPSGGAISSHWMNVTINKCIFRDCHAVTSGAVDVQSSRNTTITRCLFIGNSATRFGAAQLDGAGNHSVLLVELTNFTFNQAETWIGGVRIQNSRERICDCTFEGSRAEQYGALWDYSCALGWLSVERVCFLNNSVGQAGAGITIFHCRTRGVIENCLFRNNVNRGGQRGSAIFLYSDLNIFRVLDCIFDEIENRSILIQFPDTSGIETDSTRPNIFNKVFV